MKVNVMSDILKANDLLARDIQDLLKKKKIVSWNIMGSPGSGKTSILERLIPMFPENIRAAVIEGDIATSRDAERVARTGAQSTQINTDGACHLDAAMIRSALGSIDLEDLSILFIENVGNLICPASYYLGETGRIIVSSVTEGDDKPEKYPSIFKIGDLILLNKVDLIEQTNFSMDNFTRGMKRINSQAVTLAVSATDGTGFEELRDWTVGKLH